MGVDIHFGAWRSIAWLNCHAESIRSQTRYCPIDGESTLTHELHMVLSQIGRMATVETAQLRKALDDCLRLGGIPDALKYPDMSLLRTLYDDVLYRDIATRYRIEAISALKELAFILISNPTDLVSLNKLKERFGLGSVNTIKNCVS